MSLHEHTDYPTIDSRRHERGGEPAISVTFEGRTYSAVDWSLGGLLIDGYGGKLTSGGLFTIEEIGPEGGRMTRVEVRARVVRVEPDTRQLVVSFLDINDSAYRLLQGFMAQRMVTLSG